MLTRVATILKVPVNEATHKFDSKNHAALLSKESVTKPFKNVLVILVCYDIVCTNKEVDQIQMDKMLVNWGHSGKWGNEC